MSKNKNLNQGNRKSRKITKHKTAVFNLEPDGFSIHTFSLTRHLTRIEYYTIKENMYLNCPGTYETVSKGEEGAAYIFHHCNAFNRYGVRICLMQCGFNGSKAEHPSDYDDDGNDLFSEYFLKMTINPRKLIEPLDEYSYLGILQPTQESVDRVAVSPSPKNGHKTRGKSRIKTQR